MRKHLTGLALGLSLLISANRIGHAAPAPSAAATVPAASPAAAAPKTLVDYKIELGLKDAQLAKIKSTLGNFATQMAAKRQQLLTARQEYAKLLGGHAALEALRAKLQQIGGFELDIRWLDVITSRTIEETLTPDQLAKWRKLQESARATKK